MTGPVRLRRPAAAVERRWRLRRVVTVSVAVLVGLVLLWGVAVAVSADRARDELRTVEDDLRGLRRAARQFDLEAARDVLAGAEARVDRAVGAMNSPQMDLASRLPWVGQDLRTARTVAEASDDLLAAGLALVDAVGEVGGFEALAPRDGVIPTEPFRRLAPVAREAADTVVTARETVARADDATVFGAITEGRDRFVEALTPVATEVVRLADLTEAVPSMLGHDGPTTYFVAAANPAEARGVQGFLGAYALASFDGGRLSLTPFRPIQDLQSGASLEEIGAPEVYADRYEQLGAGGVWKNINASPDFPTVARAIENLWSRTQGSELDGVILVDPYAFQQLVKLSGPVELGDGRTIRPAQVVEYVANQAYGEFQEGDARKGTLGQIASGTLGRFLAGVRADQLKRTVGSLGELMGDRHLLIHSTDPAAQAALADLGIDGALPDEGELIAVVTNSAANSKVDYYLERTLDYEAVLRPDGRLDARLEVTFHNAAPAGGAPKHVLGPNVDGMSVGDHRFLASVFSSTSGGFTDTDPSTFSLGDEAGHDVVDAFVELPRGESVTLVYEWTTLDAVAVQPGGLVLRIDHRDQVTIAPTRVRARVVHPEGWTPVEVPDGAEVVGDAVTWSDDQAGDDVWEVVYERGA